MSDATWKGPTIRQLVEKWQREWSVCPQCSSGTRGPMDCDGPRAECLHPRCDWAINLVTGAALSKLRINDERFAHYMGE